MTDLPDARRVAAAVDLGAHEIENLLLALGEFLLVGHPRPLGIEHLYEHSVAASTPIGANMRSPFCLCGEHVFAMMLSNTRSYRCRSHVRPAVQDGVAEESTAQKGRCSMHRTATLRPDTDAWSSHRAARAQVAARPRSDPHRVRPSGSDRPDRDRRSPDTRSGRYESAHCARTLIDGAQGLGGGLVVDACRSASDRRSDDRTGLGDPDEGQPPGRPAGDPRARPYSCPTSPQAEGSPRAEATPPFHRDDSLLGGASRTTIELIRVCPRNRIDAPYLVCYLPR